MLPARIRWDGGWINASVRNISAHGLMLCSPQVPPIGAYVELRVGSDTITARTMWAKGQSYGVRARDIIDFHRLRQGGRGAQPVAPPSMPRSAVRAAGGGRTVEQSRAISNAIQYLTAAAVAALVAWSVATEVYHTLSAPLATVSGAMDAPK